MKWNERLRAARANLGLGQEQMAEFLGISYRTYQGYENGVSEPKIKVLERLVDHGFSAMWLLTGQGEMLDDLGEDDDPDMAAGGTQKSSAYETQKKRYYTPSKKASTAPLDEELNARVVDGIVRLYKEEGAGLSPMDLGRLAARVYSDLVDTFKDPEERLIGLKATLTQLKRQLHEPPAATDENKRLA